MFGFQVKSQKKSWKPYHSEAYFREGLPQLIFDTFPQAIDALIREKRAGTIDRRWAVLDKFNSDIETQPNVKGKARGSGKRR